jgi:hypothetical protein
LQPVQQTGVVPPQLLQDFAGVLAAGARSWAVATTTAKTSNATVTSFLIVNLLSGFCGTDYTPAMAGVDQQLW